LGLAANLAKCCRTVLARCLVLLLRLANIFNLGTDVSAMAAAIQLLAGGAVVAYALSLQPVHSCFRSTCHIANTLAIVADMESFRVRNHGLRGSHTLGACPEGHRDSLNFV
jgi:hypothetical protein